MKKAYLIDEKNKKLLEYIVLELNKNMREFVAGEIRQRTIQKLISEIIIPSLFEISKEDLRSMKHDEIEMDLRREKMFHENAKKYVKHLIETIERYKIECSIRNMELDQNGFLVPIKKEIKQ